MESEQQIADEPVECTDRVEKAPAIDVHAHVYHEGMPLADTAWHKPSGSATVEQFIDLLDHHGVRYAALAAASLYGDYNDYTLEVLRQHQRLRATVIIQPETGLDEMRRMQECGVVGVRLQFRSVTTPPDLGSERYQKFLRNAAELDWHIHLHDEGERLPAYIPHIEASGVKLVIDHFGRPVKGDGLNSRGFQEVLRAVQRGNTWVKLSAAFRLESLDAAKQYAAVLLREAGTERLLWGSDWPFAAFEDNMSYEKALADYYSVVPERELREAIDQTAMALYFG